MEKVRQVGPRKETITAENPYAACVVFKYCLYENDPNTIYSLRLTPEGRWTTRMIEVSEPIEETESDQEIS